MKKIKKIGKGNHFIALTCAIRDSGRILHFSIQKFSSLMASVKLKFKQVLSVLGNGYSKVSKVLMGNFIWDRD